jgi:hypothetical protein
VVVVAAASVRIESQPTPQPKSPSRSGYMSRCSHEGFIETREHVTAPPKMNLSASAEETVVYLRTLPAIRERCGRVFDIAKRGGLEYFEYHPEKEAAVAAFCVDIIHVSK